MELLEDICLCRNCSKARAACFKVAMKFRSLYFIMLNKEIRSARLVCRGLRKFLAASYTTMESLPLKELDFGLQKPTGPSSGVVASIVLVSPGLDCPGVSLAELCATCLRCHLW